MSVPLPVMQCQVRCIVHYLTEDGYCLHLRHLGTEISMPKYTANPHTTSAWLCWASSVLAKCARSSAYAWASPVPLTSRSVSKMSKTAMKIKVEGITFSYSSVRVEGCSVCLEHLVPRENLAIIGRFYTLLLKVGSLLYPILRTISSLPPLCAAYPTQVFDPFRNGVKDTSNIPESNE